MSAASDEAHNVAASTPGVGYRLQQARERKKLSIADTASQLRFTRATVVHLEQEEWDKLHSRIYARGYLLSYVKFLGLPTDEMLSAFNAQYGETERPSHLLVSKTLPLEKPFPWMSSFLIIIVLIIAAVAYQYWPQQGFELTQQSEAETSNNNVEPPLSTPPDTERLNGGLEIQATPQNAQDARDVSKLNETPIIPMTTESIPADMATDEQQTPTEPNTETVQIDTADDLEVTNEALLVEEASPGTNDNADLTLIISEPSWIEVKDNTGNTLISRVLEEETVDLNGEAPLSIRIGNVAGTSLRFNDKAIDLEPFKQNNIARLTLGAES
ncbi:MAG TPA: RodZ domain-containing protein [Methylophaga sp.]|nr:RodZ domain-containing protein [Methylophaga sp.]